MQEQPDSLLTNPDAMSRQVVPQLSHRSIRILGDKRMHKSTMRLQTPTPMTAILARPHTASHPMTLAPFYNRRYRHTKPLRN
jgi:hypothetical protein